MVTELYNCVSVTSENFVYLGGEVLAGKSETKSESFVSSNIWRDIIERIVPVID
jgi:hypothetical protein